MRHPTWSAVAAGTLVTVMACGGSETPTNPSPAAPGTVTLTSTTINNQAGKVLVVTAQQEGQSTQAGRACVAIDSNAFIVPATLMAEMTASGNPCDDPRTTKTFAAARYNLTAGIFTPGSQTAERSATQSVQVAGNMSVSLDGAALSR